MGVLPDGYAVSIPAPWEGCDVAVEGGAVTGEVSIHAPWEGCDYVLSKSVNER